MLGLGRCAQAHEPAAPIGARRSKPGLLRPEWLAKQPLKSPKGGCQLAAKAAWLAAGATDLQGPQGVVEGHARPAVPGALFEQQGGASHVPAVLHRGSVALR